MGEGKGCLFFAIIIICVIIGGLMLLEQGAIAIGNSYRSDPSGVIIGFFAIAIVAYFLYKLSK